MKYGQDCVNYLPRALSAALPYITSGTESTRPYVDPLRGKGFFLVSERLGEAY